MAASRATTLVWRALPYAKAAWRQQLLQAAARHLQCESGELHPGAGGIHDVRGLSLSYASLAQALGDARPLFTVDLHAEDPDSNAHDTHFVFGACAALAQVRVDSWSGMVQVEQLVMCTALRPTVSPQGCLGQMEGGAVMGLGMCTTEELDCIQSHYSQRNLDRYFIPSMADAPAMELLAIQNLPDADPIGPRGAGEIGVNLAVPAVANALACALHRPVTRLPMLPAHVVDLLESPL